MSAINPKKMKVAELKKELEQRSIAVTKSMKKADLMALLLSAIESETGEELNFSTDNANDSQVSIEDESQETSISEQDTTQQAKGNTSTIEDEAMDTKESSVPDSTPEEQTKLAAKVDETPEEKDEAAPMEEAPQPVEQVSQEADAPVVQEAKKQDIEEKDQDMKDVSDNKTEDSEEPPKENGDQESLPVEEKADAAPTDQAAASEGKTATATVEPVSEAADASNKDAGQSQGRKRKHEDRAPRQHRMETPPPEEEPEEDFDDSLVVLDTYLADLNFKVTRDRTGGQPLTMEGFAYLWGGTRATYGVGSGKVCFECKVAEEDPARHLPTDEPHPRVVRVGWSPESAGVQLGEEPLSFGYGGTGKFSVDRKFTDYGESFHEGDIIGCFIDFSEDDSMSISYTKNGKYLGVACTEKKSPGLVMFPHVLCKNSSVELNFGQKEQALSEFPEEVKDFVFIAKLPAEEKTRAAKGPTSRSECEVLMMCGLPGSGKTHYCRELMKEHPEKRYNVLGTNYIMDKMRVMGVSRKQNYANRWELMIHNATQCLNRLLQIASRKRRNFIIDQTNVYASAQRRKMRPFAGFQRKAVVIVPSEEEFKTRFDKRTSDEGEEVPEVAVLEMKANFTVPEKGNLFDSVVFTDLAEEEAKKLVGKYREEGSKNAPPPEKRARTSQDNQNRNRGGRGGGFRHQQPRFRGQAQRFGGPAAPWSRPGGRGGMMNFPRPYGGGPPALGRGGGYGSRPFNHGRRGVSDVSRGDRGRGGGFGQTNKGWQSQGSQNRGGYGGYNRQNQSFGGNKGRGDHSKNSGAGKRGASAQSGAPQSASSYSYINHHQSYNSSNTSKNTSGYPSTGYNFSQPSNTSQTQQGYQQSGYGQQQDYSQQWLQYYQQQAQSQYQNYYTNYQQYYGQQGYQPK